MAHTSQQRKRIRQDTKRNTENSAKKSAIRSKVKSFEKAVASGSDKGGLLDSFKALMSSLAKGARKGLVSKGAAARKTSRMNARLKNASK